MAKIDLVIRGGTVADGSGGALREADVAVQDGKIVAVGQVADIGREEIDAKGLLVTPGFIDVHTHYDGHLTWGESLDPSSCNGVTTVVVGNCGVGFAPCRPQDREGLVRLMEGVEDIPEVVMTKGLPWDWEDFPSFLDSVERKPHDIDFAVLLPHAPLRVFAMGQRAVNLEPANAADRARMRELVKEAMTAGAIGLATSRSITHRGSDGVYSPALGAEEEELYEISMGIVDAGRGILQAIPNGSQQKREDYEVMHRLVRRTGLPISYSLTQLHSQPELWREAIEMIERENAAGADITAQVINRSTGVILGLEASFHPFVAHPYYVENLAKLPLAQRVAEMRKPEVRAILIQPQGVSDHPFAGTFRHFSEMYLMGKVAEYEPNPANSVVALAAQRGVSPDEVAYDMLLEDNGHAMLLITASNFIGGNLDEALTLMRHKDTVLGLGDGGAHCGLVCDASYTTFNLTHWARDRRGDKLSVPEAVQMLTDAPAKVQRFRDRGRIAPGMKADINVIDMDRLTLLRPSVAYDLPTGGKRLTQKSTGYVATLVSGVAIQREGQDTGARPGALVRNAGF